MVSILTHLLLSTLSFSLLYMIYHAAFRQFTWFRLNRFILLAIAGISLVLPFVHITFFEISYNNLMFSGQRFVAFNPAGSETIVQIQKDDSFLGAAFLKKAAKVLLQIILIIYFTVVIYRLFIFLKNSYVIRQMIRQGRIEKSDGVQLLHTQKAVPTFSFLNYLIIGKEFEQLSAKEQNYVLAHEKAHIRQRHSFDILFAELLSVVFWFNPLVKKYRESLSEIHEYLADSEAQQQGQATDYSRLILKLSLIEKGLNIGSHFAKVHIKGRIEMLNNKKTPVWQQMQYVWFVLFFIVAFVATSVTQQLAQPVISKTGMLQLPLPEEQIVASFFENRPISEVYLDSELPPSEGEVRVSHRQLTFRTLAGQAVINAAAGQVVNIDATDNWGVEEYTLEIKNNDSLISIYSKLPEVNVETNQWLKQGDTLTVIERAAIYSSIDFQLKLNEQPIDPLRLIK